VSLTARFSDGTESTLTAMIAEGPTGTTFFSFTAAPDETLATVHMVDSIASAEWEMKCHGNHVYNTTK